MHIEDSTEGKVTAKELKSEETKPTGPRRHNTKISAAFGSRNLGNTCFFNSAMQCLNATLDLREFYIKNGAFFNKENKVLRRFGNLNRNYSNYLSSGRMGSVVDPSSLFSSVKRIDRKYAYYSQQDGPELYRVFVDALVMGELSIMK